VGEDQPLYTLGQHDNARITPWTIEWKPGEEKTDNIYGRGQFRLVRDEESLPWREPENDILVFGCYGNTDVDYIDSLYIGTSQTPVEFLEDGLIFGAFNPSDESDKDTQEESFRESVDNWIRKLLGNRVPEDVTWHQLSRVNGRLDPVVSARFDYTASKRPEGVSDDWWEQYGHKAVLNAITITTEGGVEKTLQIY